MTEPVVIRRAVGEVLMIVVGVLIALAASDWQQRHTERLTERDMLRELSTGLESDLILLEAHIKRHERIEERVTILLQIMESGAPYADSIDAYFGTLYGIAGPQLNIAGYESLKSQGLDLVSDDELRSHIARVYERSYALVFDAIDSERMVILDLLRPYVLLHFRDLRFNESATPIRYEQVVGDQYFINLTDYRLQLVKQNHLPQLREAVPQIRALNEAVDRELNG